MNQSQTMLLKAAVAGILALAVKPDVCAQTTRHYYLAAEAVEWDFAPSGQDLVHGGVHP